MAMKACQALRTLSARKRILHHESELCSIQTVLVNRPYGRDMGSSIVLRTCFCKPEFTRRGRTRFSFRSRSGACRIRTGRRPILEIHFHRRTILRRPFSSRSSAEVWETTRSMQIPRTWNSGTFLIKSSFLRIGYCHSLTSATARFISMSESRSTMSCIFPGNAWQVNMDSRRRVRVQLQAIRTIVVSSFWIIHRKVSITRAYPSRALKATPITMACLLRYSTVSRRVTPYLPITRGPTAWANPKSA